MLKADEILKLVNDYLDNMPYDRKPSSLYEPIRYVLSMGETHPPCAYAACIQYVQRASRGYLDASMCT